MVLIGGPTALRGMLMYVNNGERDAVVAGLRIRSDVVPAGVLHASASAVIPPNASRRVSVSVALDRQTPPGEYAGEVETTEGVRPVVLHVTGVVELEVAPKRLYVTPAGAGPVATTLVLANRGNVPIRVPAAARTEAGESGTLTMRLGPKATTLDVGEVRAYDIELTTPEHTDPAVRQDIGLALGPADLTIVVLPTADETVTPHSSATPRRLEL
jgi:hypothetical protein